MRVLLVHGLGRTPVSLHGLARALKRANHSTRLFGYYAFAEHYDRIRLRLASGATVRFSSTFELRSCGAKAARAAFTMGSTGSRWRG